MENIIYDNKDYKGQEYKTVEPLDWQKKYVNKKFGKLTFISPVWVKGKITRPDTTSAIWLTHCDCGNDYCVGISNPRKAIKQNLYIPDCGCGARAEQDQKYIGKTYNQLTVLERDDKYKKEHQFSNKNTYYKCRCTCGNIIHVRINALVAGEIKSCGCLKEKQDKINLIPNKIHDLTGQRFGKLIALSYFKQPNGEYWWHCRCDCGNYYDVRGYSLVRGDTTSCGCLLKSKGEIQIENILKEHNIKYLYDYALFKDLQLPSGGIGRYDFILLDKDYTPYRLIEYDGEQHFKPREFFGGQEEFKKRQLNDKTKNEYAIKKHLPLVRIPYTENNITINTILGDKYLINL